MIELCNRKGIHTSQRPGVDFCVYLRAITQFMKVTKTDHIKGEVLNSVPSMTEPHDIGDCYLNTLDSS